MPNWTMRNSDQNDDPWVWWVTEEPFNYAEHTLLMEAGWKTEEVLKDFQQQGIVWPMFSWVDPAGLWNPYLHLWDFPAVPR